MIRYLLLVLAILFPTFVMADGELAPNRARQIRTDVTNFDSNLSSTDTTVQKALETLDELVAGGGSGSGNVGIGTVNYMPVYVGISTLGPSNMVHVAGNIGIDGTPTERLLVRNSNTSSSDGIRIDANNPDAGCDSNTNLLLHFDGSDASTTFTDSECAGAAKTATAVGNAQLDTAQFKFGTASGLYDGTGDRINFPDNADWFWSTAAFTVDFWVRFNSLAANAIFFSQEQDGSNGGGMQWLTSNNIRFVWDGTASSITVSKAWTPSTGTWYHVALIRGWGGNVNDWAITIDGTQIGTTTTDADAITDVTAVFNVGGTPGTYFGGEGINGWIDEFRVTKGAARWTANFTPQASAYTEGNASSYIKYQENGITSWALGLDGADSNKFKIGTTAIDTNTRLTIDSSGNVGIGTTVPPQKLYVAGTIEGQGFKLNASASAGSLLTSNSVGVGTWMATSTINAGTATALAANPTNCSAGNYPLGIDASGNVESCTAAGGGTNYWALEAGNVGINTTTVNVGIGTSRTTALLTVGSTGQSAFNSSGNLGLGTFIPTSALTIGSGSTQSTLSTSASMVLGASGSYNILQTNGGTQVKALAFDSNKVVQIGDVAGLASSTSIGFYQNGELAMVVDTNKNVGIGTTIPGGGLAVMNGNVGIGTWKPANLLAVGSTSQLTVNSSGQLTAPVNSQIGICTAGSTSLLCTTNAAISMGNSNSSGSASLAVQGGANAASNLTLKSTTASGSTDYIQLGTGNNGANLTRIISSGNVGIGTTIPGGGLVVMNGNVGIGTYNPEAPFVVKGSGNIGIGTTNLGYGFMTVDAGASTGQLRIDGDSGACLMLQDTDNAGWTECDALNGVLTCGTDADGICD